MRRLKGRSFGIEVLDDALEGAHLGVLGLLSRVSLGSGRAYCACTSPTMA
mgnify:CR=1 FL=1